MIGQTSAVLLVVTALMESIVSGTSAAVTVEVENQAIADIIDVIRGSSDIDDVRFNLFNLSLEYKQ